MYEKIGKLAENFHKNSDHTIVDSVEKVKTFLHGNQLRMRHLSQFLSDLLLSSSSKEKEENSTKNQSSEICFFISELMARCWKNNWYLEMRGEPFQTSNINNNSNDVNFKAEIESNQKVSKTASSNSTTTISYFHRFSNEDERKMKSLNLLKSYFGFSQFQIGGDVHKLWLKFFTK